MITDDELKEVRQRLIDAGLPGRPAGGSDVSNYLVRGLLARLDFAEGLLRDMADDGKAVERMRELKAVCRNMIVILDAVIMVDATARPSAQADQLERLMPRLRAVREVATQTLGPK